MCDDTDHTWKSFCKNIVYKQVDNILCYPYKFTKLVNIQQIVVGVKQEGVISASKCIYHNRGIYLFREKTKLKEDIFSTKAVSFESGDWLNTLLFLTAQVKHLLNKDLSRQPIDPRVCWSATQATKTPSLFSRPGKKGENLLCERYRVEYGFHASLQKILEQKSWRNLCEQSLASLKAGEIQGAINVVWTLEKTKHLRQEVEDQEPRSCKCVLKPWRKTLAGWKPTNCRTTRSRNWHAPFELFQVPNSCQLKKIHEKVDNVENFLGVIVTELWKAQDALRKSFENKRKIVGDLQAEAEELKQESEGALSSDDLLEESK